MKAVVFKDVGQVAVEEVDRPVIQDPTDAIIQVRKASVCGSDLHIYHGRVPGVFEGATLGHEYAGTVVEVGPDVKDFKPGDDVVGSFLIVCGACKACTSGHFSHCNDQMSLGYGVFLGDLGGSQAEFVRVPIADVNLHLADGMDLEKALFAGDILSTAFYCAHLGGITGGETVVVIGCGPVGILAQEASRVLGAARVIAIDTVPERLEMAAKLGSEIVNALERNPAMAIDEMTGGEMADVVLETVGLPPALDSAISTVKRGGTISIIGVHTEPTYEFPLQEAFLRSLKFVFGGTANVQGVWDEALEAIRSGKIDPTVIVSHHMSLEESVEAYKIFDAKKAMKIIIDVS
ncbi:MAG: alcohol dehydrogenase catalytic domain-containing protein [Actinomycetota bacterium]|jgi:2-desacetyl-2-hydroxyethyl bacteriochlorophyllide A dehydrogenase